MKKPLAELIPAILKVAAPATAAATAIVAPLAQAASGDLDPDYADHGRAGPLLELKGPARSLESLEDGGALLGGGAVEANCYWWYCYYDPAIEASSFVSALTDQGAIDDSYHGAAVTSVEVFDIARQGNGKVVAAGRRVASRNATYNKLVVFRLRADGSLDAGFGAEGIVELDAEIHGIRNQANAVLLDPDGRIVVAGARDEALIVLRLNGDGSFDDSFGTDGLFIGPAHDYFAGARLARTSSGGYRVTTADGVSCRVLGLTAEGAIDATYGDAGYAPVAEALGGALACHSAAVQPDDRLLVTGLAAGQSFAVRLLPDGAPDPAFTTADVSSSLQEATAIAVAPDGKILIGGNGLRGASVMRLQATGELDALFGDSGETTIDLPSESGASPLIHEIEVQADGAALVAGGDYASFPPRPFVARLLGDGGGDGAGVLSFQPGYLDAAESDQVSVTVRRTGGKTGAVSVAYRTQPNGGRALEGQDYESVAGELHWDDGDAGERSIAIPIVADGGEPEEYESFALALDVPDGGAGLGTRSATITIQPDGAPAGQFALDVYESTVQEYSSLQFWLYRNYYIDGAVCVTLEGKSRTATAGVDFIADPRSYCWDDQDNEAKLIEIEIVDDKTREGDETFRIELSDPTGGAIIGSRGSATITIVANDAPVRASGGGGRGGGGGSAGLFSLLLLGFAELLRSARRRFRNQG
jgi:uncharacterized delta-60 repeat protein